jgi:Flp pilus assembly protein TadG
MRHINRKQQQGAVIITVCLLMLFLLGFIGFALDFGRLFVVKSELQTAMDSCALAAAQELNSQPTAIDRARAAGVTAGNLNNVDFQSANWSGQAKLVAAEITFKDASYADTTSPTVATYVQCQHLQSGTKMWLMHMLGVFSGNTTVFPTTRAVVANAVATRASAQTSCPVPLALKPVAGGTAANNYGFTPGQWIKLLMGAGAATNGEIGWANLDGSNSASETVAEMDGSCGTEVGDTLGTPGVQATVADVWNYRFGIYKNNVSPGTPATHNPDYSGYAYTTTNWPRSPTECAGIPGTLPCKAYFGAKPPGAHATAENFDTKRAKFASCSDDIADKATCEAITGLNLNPGGFKDIAAPGAAATGGHHQYGRDRRTVVVPVVNGAMVVVDWACMLLLQPITSDAGGMLPNWLEFLGLAGATGVPCTTNGMPGGTVGPLVPTLVR